MLASGWEDSVKADTTTDNQSKYNTDICHPPDHPFLSNADEEVNYLPYENEASVTCCCTSFFGISIVLNAGCKQRLLCNS